MPLNKSVPIGQMTDFETIRSVKHKLDVCTPFPGTRNLLNNKNAFYLELFISNSVCLIVIPFDRF